MNNQVFFNPLYSEPTHSSDTTLFGSYGNFEHHSNNISKVSELSLFTNHELKPNSSLYYIRNKNDNDLLFSFLIADLIIIIVLLGLYKKQVLNTTLALFSSKYYQQIEGKSLIKHPLTPSLFSIFLLNTSSLIYILLNHNILDIEVPDTPYLLIYIIGGLLSFYFIKILFVFFSSHIFNVANHGKTYINYILLWTTNMGVFLSFFLWLVIYTYHWILIPIFLLFYLLFTSLRILHTTTRILPKTDFNSFHFFLYLCTVEILPLIVLGKIVISGF